MTGLNDAMFARPPVYARQSDLAELWRIAADGRKAALDVALFLEELERLSIAPGCGDADFVRLGSSVFYRDLRTKRQRRIKLVRPGTEEPDENEVSLLSPIGSALVGLKEGAIFRWVGADGRLRAIKVLDVSKERP